MANEGVMGTLKGYAKEVNINKRIPLSQNMKIGSNNTLTSGLRFMCFSEKAVTEVTKDPYRRGSKYGCLHCGKGELEWIDLQECLEGHCRNEEYDGLKLFLETYTKEYCDGCGEIVDFKDDHQCIEEQQSDEEKEMCDVGTTGQDEPVEVVSENRSSGTSVSGSEQAVSEQREKAFESETAPS